VVHFCFGVPGQALQQHKNHFDFGAALCYKIITYTNDHIQAKGIPLKSGADPPL